jgi:hypothetical protein
MLKAIVFHALFSFYIFCSAQNNDAKNNRSITISPPIYQPDVVVIPFSIPNSGMVEFYLYDDITNKGILRTQLICERGDSVIKFSRKKLEDGIPYKYEVIYKGQKISGKLRP